MAENWNTKPPGTKWGHYFFYTMVRLGGRPLARPLAYFFLYFVIFAYTLFPSVKQKCGPYLSRRFPGCSKIKLFIHRYRLILSLGKILVDRAILGILGPGSIHADFDNPEEFHAIKGLDSGFIILMSHVGCWQVAMSALSRLNRPVNLLMLQTDQDMDKHYYEHKGNEKKLKIISPDQFLGGTLEMLNVLKNNEIVCIMGDRIFGNRELSLEIDFLGDKTRFPFSAYKLASISQKPIVILNSYKSGPASYKLSLPHIIHVPPKLGKVKKKYAKFARRYAKTLEAYIKARPYQFFNFYDMWTDLEINTGNNQGDPAVNEEPRQIK